MMLHAPGVERCTVWYMVLTSSAYRHNSGV